MRKQDSYKHKRNFKKIILISFSILLIAFLGSLVYTHFTEQKTIKDNQKAALAATAANQAKLEVTQARLSADPITISGIYTAINKVRPTAGASAMGTVQNLTTAAEKQCSDMVVNKYFALKNPTSGKDASSYIGDYLGDLYFKSGSVVMMRADTATQTATEVINTALKEQASILNDPRFNSVGWAICPSSIDPKMKYVVGMLAEKADRPARVNQPRTNSSRSNCVTTYTGTSYYSPGVNPMAFTSCY